MDAPDPAALLDRIVAATNAHDLDALVECFTTDYVNETPAHPMRGFRGREQVRRNWTQIFGGVPDLRCEVLARAIDGDTVWSEWRMTGTRRDGAQHEMVGIVVFTADAAGRAASARFFLEPLDRSSGSVDDALRRTVGSPATGATSRP